MVRHPLGLLADWNWKAALFSAMIRGVIFFTTNLRAGHSQAIRATVVELVYATVAAGFAGAITQRLRHAVPVRLTATVVCIAIPIMMLSLQAFAHTITGTPHMRTGLIVSFLFASIATAFNWFSMSRGAFVTGEDRSFLRDLIIVPKLLVQFVTAPLRRSPSQP
jgi:di/tricarboxylate transporter